MIEVYDLNLKRTAVLQNAFGGEEEEVLNDVPSYTFQIPSGDEKCRYLKKRHFIRASSGGNVSHHDAGRGSQRKHGRDVRHL